MLIGACNLMAARCTSSGRSLAFSCQIDSDPPFACADGPVTGFLAQNLTGTPMPYNSAMPSTRHTFSVLTTDEAGNAETTLRSFSEAVPSAAFNAYSWNIDNRAPITTVTSDTPAEYGTELRHTFQFASDEVGGRFDCTLEMVNGTAPRIIEYVTETASPLVGSVTLPDALRITAFPDGYYALNITAIDVAGNRGNTIRVSWIIDTTAPYVVLTQPSGNDFFETDLDFVTLSFSSPILGYQLPVRRFLCALDCLRVAERCSSWEVSEAGRNSIVGPDGVRLPVCAAHRTPTLQNFSAMGTDAVIARYSGGNGQVHTADCQDSSGDAEQPTYHPCNAGEITFVGLRSGRHIFRVKAIDLVFLT